MFGIENMIDQLTEQFEAVSAQLEDGYVPANILVREQIRDHLNGSDLSLFTYTGVADEFVILADIEVSDEIYNEYPEKVARLAELYAKTVVTTIKTFKERFGAGLTGADFQLIVRMVADKASLKLG
jgi:hypothetical protein